VVLPIGRRDHATRGYSDRVPVLVLILALILAVLIWRYAAQRKAAPALRPRFVGPDDDPDFLRELGRRTRKDDDLS
jgi:hypothetical protein